MSGALGGGHNLEGVGLFWVEHEEQSCDPTYEDMAIVGPWAPETEEGEEYQTEYDDMYCTGGGDPAASYEAFGHYTEDGEWVEDEECVD
ncbi:MAG: hypothetical protein AB7L94_37895, partial [Kofleriaceae bacterium]